MRVCSCQMLLVRRGMVLSRIDNSIDGFERAIDVEGAAERFLHTQESQNVKSGCCLKSTEPLA